MQQKINLLNAKYLELREAYEQYLEAEYEGKVTFSICPDRDPDFDTWTAKNCLEFREWAMNFGDEELMDEISDVLFAVFPEDD